MRFYLKRQNRLFLVSMTLLLVIMVIHTIKAGEGGISIGNIVITNFYIHLGLVGIILMLTLFFGHYEKGFLNKMDRIKKLIEDVSNGNLNVTISEDLKHSPDEIGDLANALDRILVSLKLAVKRK